MSKYNIELAHIYVDELFGENQRKSLDIFKEKVKKNLRDYTTTLLVDDYNPKTNFLDIPSMLKEITKLDVSVDFLVFESTLTPYCDKILQKIPKKYLKAKLFGTKHVLLLDYDGKLIGLRDQNGKYSCSLLIAAWILCRLGYFSFQDFAFNNSRKDFVAKNLINILEKKYYESEMKVFDILRASGFGEVIKKIKYFWY